MVIIPAMIGARRYTKMMIADMENQQYQLEKILKIAVKQISISARKQMVSSERIQLIAAMERKIIVAV